MSQPIPSSANKKRIRWRWAILVAVGLTPFVLVVALISLYLITSQQRMHEALLQAQASQRALSQARQLEGAMRAAVSSAAAPPVASLALTTPKKQAQVVKIQLDFEDFESRTADAITVACEENCSLLIVPSDVFTPMTTKINGRMVTRPARHLRVVEFEDGGPPGMSMGGMAMPGMPAPSNISIFAQYPAIGLTQLLLPNWKLTPVRVFGDFPKAAIGDKLTVVSSTHYSPAPVLKVLGTDERAQNASGAKFEHLLKLSGWIGPVGTMVCNDAGDPIGQILFTVPDKQTYTYALPMDRIFATIQDGTNPPALPGASDQPTTLQVLTSDGKQLTVASQDAKDEEKATIGLSSERLVGTPADITVPTSPVGDPLTPADATQLSVRPAEGERRIYRVQGFAPDVADTVRSLYGTEAKVAVDRGSRSVIVIASPAVQEKILATIDEMNRGVRELMAEQALKAELEKNQQDALTTEKRMELDLQQKEAAARAAAEEESHRKNPKRTRIVKVDGRDPREISKILSTLFGQKADIAIDEQTRAVLITVNRATTWSEVQFLLSEIEATATRLAAEAPQVARTTPTTTELGREKLTKNGTSGGSGLSLGDQYVANLDREAKQLALQLRTAAPSEQAAVREKLEQQLDRQFRERQSLRKQEIDDLSSRIENLRATQSRRETNRAEIIRRRVNELLDPDQDLNWEESQAATNESTAAPEKVAVKESAKETGPTAVTEPTFDGIPYSQWRKMLNVEKKPEKLMAAMDACARLATVEDAHQVAKELIRATGSELSDSHEHSEVWRAAIGALERMPPDAVIDEIVASLNPSVSRDRTFQGVFLAEYNRPAAMAKALNDRGQQVVAVLIKEIPQKATGSDWLLAGACRIWEDSNRTLDEFEGLRPLVMQRVDSLPEGDWTLRSYPRFQDSWFVVVNALTRKNPETPGLAVKLMKHSTSIDSNAFSQIVNQVGQLGHHAEPAVPMIVEQFLGEWGKIENEAGYAIPGPRRGALEAQDGSNRAAGLIKLLGIIGVGDKAASLLKELNLISTMPSGINPNAREVFMAATNAIDKFDDIPTEDGPPILSDKSLIRGVWQVQSANSQPLQNSEAWIGRDGVAWVVQDNGQHIGEGITGHFIGNRMELDSTKSPKEIEFLGKPRGNQIYRRNGIYELTETTLKIYLAPTGMSRPAAMVKSAADIPEDYSLIELRRSLPDRPPRPKP